MERYYPDSTYSHWDPVLRCYRPYWEAPYYRREYYDPVLRAYRPYYDAYYPAYTREYYDPVLRAYRPVSLDYKYWDPVLRIYRYSPYYWDRYVDYRVYADRLLADRPYYRYDPVYRCERIWDPVLAIYSDAIPALSLIHI